jgi:hypothetical protein
MSDCQSCPVEKDCHYFAKPCDCVHQRKFWTAERAEEFYKNNPDMRPRPAVEGEG